MKRGQHRDGLRGSHTQPPQVSTAVSSLPDSNGRTEKALARFLVLLLRPAVMSLPVALQLLLCSPVRSCLAINSFPRRDLGAGNSSDDTRRGLNLRLYSHS